MKKSSAIIAIPRGYTAVALKLPGNLSFDEWEAIGTKLQAASAAVHWWLGDWWAFGDAKYGERAAQAMDPEFPWAFQTCRDAAWVSRAIETSRRRDVLSWSHHREVAALEPKDQDHLLDQAIAEDWSRSELRRAVHRFRANYRPVSPPPLDGTYNVILADPPWRHEQLRTDSRDAETHYDTMPLDEIKELPINKIVASDCVLFLWSPSPKLAEALEVVAAWDFVYRTCLTWVKDRRGMGHYVWQRHELLLVAVRGEPGTPPEHARPDSVIEAPRGRHSEKPMQVYSMIEDMYPDACRIELFARRSRPGWASWGNELAA